MARIVCIASPTLWDSDIGNMNVLSYKSTMITRVCRSTLNAETKANVKCVEEGIRLRAAIGDARGLLDIKRWEETAAQTMRHIWLTDCESLSSHLNNPTATPVDCKRLEIDLEGQRQLIWEDADGTPKDSLEENQTDKIRWIDTSAMIADPLTKAMKADRLENTLHSGILDLRPTDASVISKMMKQKARAKTDDAEDE